MTEITTAYPVDGNTHGYDGEIVMHHKNGTYHLAYTNQIDMTVWRDHRGRENYGYRDTLESGYTHWLPLNVFFK